MDMNGDTGEFGAKTGLAHIEKHLTSIIPRLKGIPGADPGFPKGGGGCQSSILVILSVRFEIY
jgi:hypothetical protein